MNQISLNFRNTNVSSVPLASSSVSQANSFLTRLFDISAYNGFVALPLMSNLGDLEAMLLIPASQSKDLIIPPNLINRGGTALKDRWCGDKKDELAFRSIKVKSNGNLGDQFELVSFSRKALLTVLSNPESLKLIQEKVDDRRYSAEKVLNAYMQVQYRAAQAVNPPNLTVSPPPPAVILNHPDSLPIEVEPAPVEPTDGQEDYGLVNDDPDGIDDPRLSPIGISAEKASGHGLEYHTY
jgi:hypothetical protein